MRRAIALSLVVVLAWTTASCALGVMPDPIPVNHGLRGTAEGPVQPGNEGPCGTASRDVLNPQQWELPTAVFEPTGPGMCSAGGRPVIFFGHGYVASFTWAYKEFIEHLVSRGFVVIYPGYQLAFDPFAQYVAEDGGFVAGAASLAPGRADLSKIGFVGHSFGAGMIPKMMQMAAGRGWGSKALWAVQLSPAWEFGVGDGPIALPAHARVMTVSYEWDVFVDTQVATEGLRAMTIPDGQKLQVLLHTDARFAPALASDHLTPLTVTLPLAGGLSVGASLDYYDRWATWRPVDAWAGCALEGIWCDHDYSDMGAYRGVGVTPATVGLGLPDTGPGAIVECASWLSPRKC